MDAEHVDVEALIHGIGKGDTVAFRQFHDNFSGLLYATAFRVLGNEDDARDTTQEVLFMIWEKAPMYDISRGKPLTWAMTMTRNKAIDKLRSLQRKMRLRDELENVNSKIDHLTERGPSDELEHAERNGVLRAALGKLGADQRQAIELAYFGGLTQQEIATTLNEPLGTVKARIRRGVAQLKRLVDHIA